MDWTSSEIIAVLSFLLPGFVAAWVFHGLTPYPKPPQFERLISALILTAIVNAVVATVQLISDQTWTDEERLAIAVLVSVIVGVLFALMANRDLPIGS
jgi:chromate transport protein ChrA